MPEGAVAERLAVAIEAMSSRDLCPAVRTACETLVLDVAGLCAAARSTDYVASVVASLDGGGPCTAIGHGQGFDPASAMLVNGTAAHGEDFDDTFEGGPVHCGAVIVPAVLAAAERHGLGGTGVLRGLAVGCEVLCRLSLVVPRAVHKSGFHPTAVFGTVGAAAGVGAALGLPARELTAAMGTAGSMASGIIEYLAEGTWTKRLHPGWAAQSGYRAAMLARAGFLAPRTVFEGAHGLFNGFARTAQGDWQALIGEFGRRWAVTTIAIKPYACGTMTHPYIDCARRLRQRGIKPEQIAAILCKTSEGYVHRLWEPLAAKQAPPNGYAAKFSVPYAVAAGLVFGEAGLAAFDDRKVVDPQVLALTRKVGYVVDPDDPYPRQYTGHLRATLTDGQVIEERQPHLRGGAAEPLKRTEIEAKFRANCRHGQWTEAQAAAALAATERLFGSERVDLAAYRG